MTRVLQTAAGRIIFASPKAVIGLASQGSGPTDGSVAVILAAAGESRRMSGINKIFTPIMGMPLIAHTVSAFEGMKPALAPSPWSCPKAHLDAGRSLTRDMGWSKLTPDRVCKGGARPSGLSAEGT